MTIQQLLHPPDMEKTSESDQELTENEEKTRDLILTLPLFDAFKSDELDILARHMNFAEILRGEHLFVEGDKGDFMCFVVRGLLDVLKKTTAGDYRVIARLGKGNAIGEMSIIDKSPRSAAVVARQPSVVIILTKRGFDILTEYYPSVGVTLLKKVMQLLSLNMRLTTSKLADKLPD
ncbi:cyclic nucleotide-binding domain-containing protein [uncultured Desulfobulbus sp.]|uniref:cyclic nucleotide-binding domain-containing protein n=1 Tax=uncultured Desulfobulbus sp. TaxID=239745 RepID=UPI0029C91984|nr:cyclic nucleotide-binding domain-containing protein [uncultured Desulfobulbus sp.]